LFRKDPGPLERGDNHKNGKIGRANFEIFFSRNIGQEKLRFI
jgi:hypothetical protein